MTIIAACINDQGSAIASDSLGSNGWNCSTYGSKLIQPFPNIAVGFSDTYLVERWVRRFFRESITRDNEDGWKNNPNAFRNTVEDSWDTWRQWMKDRGHGKTDSSGTFSVPGTVIVATPKSIFVLYSDGFSLVPECGYAAIGSGTNVSLGALAIMKDSPPKIAVEAAVQAAILHVPSCGGEIHVIDLKE